MADTDYATLAQFKERMSLSTADHEVDVPGQAFLNVAARVVDWVARGPRPPNWPYPAFSASVSVTRHYPEPYRARAPEPIPIDDFLTVTAVTRGGAALTNVTDYVLEPTDDLPKTVLVLAPWAGLYAPTLIQGRSNIAVTGTTGYCAAAARPPEIAEATLLQALIFYQRYGLDVQALAEAVRDPLKAADATVRAMLIGVTKCPLC